MDIASIPNTDAAEAAATAVVVQQIAHDRIVPSPFNRTKLGNLGELADSIAKHGVLQNLLVRPLVDGTYELICGERRWRAAAVAKLATLPCVVHDWDDLQVIDAQIDENIHRKDLSALDEAETYQLALEKGRTIESLAARIGKPESTIRARLSLLRLSPVVRKALEDEQLTASHALLIAALGDHKVQEEALGTYYKGRVLEWKGEGKADIEPLTVRELKLVIATRFLLRLDGAPFDRDDATLVPEAGACTGCEFRTGNQREMFDAKSKDLCTKASCFEKKKGAAWDRAAADAQRRGLVVLGVKDTAKVFPAAPHTRVAYDSPWIDLAEDLPQDLADRSGKKTWSQLLGKDAPPPVAIAKDGTGKARQLVERKACIDRATEAGKLAERNAKGAAVKESKVDHDAERKKQLEKHAARLGAVNAALEKVGAAAAKPLPEGKDRPFWKLLIELILPSLSPADAKKVLKRRELVPDEAKGAKATELEVVQAALAKAFEKLKGDELRGLVVELLAADRAVFVNSPEYGKRLQLVAAHYRIDLKELEARAAVEVKTKAAATAAKKSAKKPAPAKGGAK